MRTRVDVMHGVNFDVLGRRDPELYGGLSLTELEVKIKRFARELEMEPSFSQTNHEGEFVEGLHKAAEGADGLILNPGAWTHYSWAIRDLCIACVQGKGVDGYRQALVLLKERLA